MTTPLSNRPKITQRDISLGYVIRYFVQNVSIPKIIEIDEKQYNVFTRDTHYKAIKLNWLITGNANDIYTSTGIIYGTRHKNLTTINWYSKKLIGLDRVLQNPLEYFQGVYNSLNDT